MRALSPREEANLLLIAQLASTLTLNADHSGPSAFCQDRNMTHELDKRDLQLAAKAEYDGRALRTSFFDDTFFAEPAWDILLDLYIQQFHGHRTSITSACIAARVPATTALRWIGQLYEAGLVNRRRDKEDCRRWFLELTANGLSKMEAYLTRKGGNITSIRKDAVLGSGLPASRSVGSR